MYVIHAAHRRSALLINTCYSIIECNLITNKLYSKLQVIYLSLLLSQRLDVFYSIDGNDKMWAVLLAVKKSPEFPLFA